MNAIVLGDGFLGAEFRRNGGTVWGRDRFQVVTEDCIRHDAGLGRLQPHLAARADLTPRQPPPAHLRELVTSGLRQPAHLRAKRRGDYFSVVGGAVTAAANDAGFGRPASSAWPFARSRATMRGPPARRGTKGPH